MEVNREIPSFKIQILQSSTEKNAHYEVNFLKSSCEVKLFATNWVHLYPANESHAGYGEINVGISVIIPQPFYGELCLPENQPQFLKVVLRNEYSWVKLPRNDFVVQVKNTSLINIVKIREGDHVASIKIYLPCTFTTENVYKSVSLKREIPPPLTDLFPYFWAYDRKLKKRLEDAANE
jgi:hypothetical protein